MRTPIPTLPIAPFQLDSARRPAPARELPFAIGAAPAAQAFPFAAQASEAAPEQVAGKPPATPEAAFELGLTCAAMGFHTAAMEAFQELTAVAPGHAAGWLKLAEMLRLAAKDGEAAAAEAKAEACLPVAASPQAQDTAAAPVKFDKDERKFRTALNRGRRADAAFTLREHLFKHPADVAAMRMLAEVERQDGDGVTATALLRRALDLQPGYIGARSDYADILVQRRHYVLALPETGRLLAYAPHNKHYRSMRADVLGFLGDFSAAIELFESVIKDDAGNAGVWLSYGHALHFVGRRDDSVAAYRTCIKLAPDMGEAYWGLADLKGQHVSETDIATMRSLLERGNLELSGQTFMYYAIAQTLERSGDYASSFVAYDSGASAFRANTDASDLKGRADSVDRILRMKDIFSARNLATKLRQAPEAGDTPIFVVGMPRAGSTLLEQILASHSLVEGTRELPAIGDITRDLSLSRLLVTPTAYPDCIADLTQKQLAALGKRYIDHATAYRHSAKPYFVDKRPWNWLDAGLIHLMLPHAKIIDIRREPMAACFAMFKQLLPADANWTYDMRELGRYYNRYVAMMEHWERVMPGRIHFLKYENLVENTEDEIRRLLDYCGLPFEEGCLRFWQTDRAVATPSAEQVRRPIFKDALQQWRNFEPWLGPLKESLAQPVEL